MVEQLRVGLQEARGRLQEFEAAVGDVAPFSMGEILDGMIEDFNNRWGDGSDLLMFKYGQTGSGKGQPCGYTPEQILQFACDPRMVNLPYGNDSVPEDKQEIIWGRVQDAVETLMKEGEQQKDGKGKEVVDEEGVSSVRTEGSGGSGSGGSRPGFGGRMPKLPTLVSKHDFKVRAKEEVDTYRAVAGKQYMDGLLLVDSNPLVWWKTYAATFPYLAQVARRYLAMPVTSAPVERLFSVVGQLVTATRNRLHPETVTLLVFLHEDLPLHRDMKFPE
jgi:hypothetical protein